ncbi:kinesin-13, putative [Babesia caballi]|uniref:Kinesin-like protein n=1 Tax=Babesia caballi TaxID=5871 RepID=A0AAV4LVD2_BABCB|nr:kinesin-13, putative [Babesia caballi]
MAKVATERSRIDVIVRKRPLSELEIARGEIDVVMCDDSTATIEEPKLRIDGSTYIDRYEFRVDRVYNEHADNKVIYEEYVRPLVEFAFKQQKTCSCFTYGQTGSGKTFTMIGSRKLKHSNKPYMPGIYEYAANDIYNMLREPEYDGRLEVVISFYEIYCGKLYDLLQDRKLLEALDNGKREVIIKDLTVCPVACKEDLIAHMLGALALRKIGQNSQNDQSSRSHALLRIELREIESQVNCGRIAFIDLAGSERGADCMNQPKHTQMDGAGINRSLLALKECIRAMDLEKTHIPFRDSELTKVLRDIFVGGSKNLMIANICPSNVSCEQTLNTLRYASRVKNFRQLQPNGKNTGVESERESSNIYRTHMSSTSYDTNRILRAHTSAPANGQSLSISPRLRNAGLLATKVTATSQKVNKTRGTAAPLSSRSATYRRSGDTTSPIESARSAREATAQPNRSRTSRLPDPFERIAPYIKSQHEPKASVDAVLEEIVLDAANQTLYNTICASLPSDGAKLATSMASPTRREIERSLDTLRRAEELSNHVALKSVTLSGNPEMSGYLDFLRNKVKMQVKPLLFLKQVIEEHHSLMQVDTATSDMDQ